MAVLKNKRGLSKLEFYHNARRMRREITELLLRDFGVKDEDEYYQELITEFRKNIRLLLRNLLWNITSGNTIYPTNESELVERRHHQTAAIVNCEQLLQEFLYCEDVLPLKVSKFLPYVEKIEFEIKLLKGWRKSGNKLKNPVKS